MTDAIHQIKETRQQSGVSSSKADITIANALAGTGKTHSLVGYALKNPSLKILCLVFSKGLVEGAQARFPSNVIVKTVHSVAYGKVGFLYKDKLSFGLRVTDVVQVLGLKDNFSAGNRVLATLNAYLVSDKENITDVVDHTHPSASITLDLTEALWNIMKDVNDKRIGMLHDGYLKLYQLTYPVIMVGNKRFDVILLDEAQDTNPVTADIVERQMCRKVYVGDRHQQIFLFRGAFNVMKFITGEQHYLTDSFRFGTEIADAANVILHAKGERHELRGLGKKGLVGYVDERLPYTVISRTNSAIFNEAISANRDITFVGGINGYRFNMVEEAYNLFARKLVKDPYINGFGNFAKMEKFTEDNDDPELKMLVKVVNTHGHDIPKLINQVRDRTVDSGGHITFTTAHKSKGLEWNQVKMTDDFIKIDKYKDQSSMGDITEKELAELDCEMNLLYVAATRAKTLLHPADALRKFI